MNGPLRGPTAFLLFLFRHACLSVSSIFFFVHGRRVRAETFCRHVAMEGSQITSFFCSWSLFLFIVDWPLSIYSEARIPQTEREQQKFNLRSSSCESTCHVEWKYAGSTSFHFSSVELCCLAGDIRASSTFFAAFVLQCSVSSLAAQSITAQWLQTRAAQGIVVGGRSTCHVPTGTSITNIPRTRR